MTHARITGVNYLGKETFEIDYDRFVDYRWRVPIPGQAYPELGEDLMIVASLVQVADRAVRRRMRLGEFVRDFVIEASVFCPERWRTAAPHLTQALSFLSGDNWRFEFRSRQNDAPKVTYKNATRSRRQDSRDYEEYPTAVVLFSGGLDSFCGASYFFTSKADQHPIFFSSYLKDLTRLYDGLLKPLAQKTSASFSHLPIYFSLRRPGIMGFTLKEFPESTRRTRSYFYLSQAATIALIHNISDIYIFENGVLSLNLPLRFDFSGARATRHSHPYFLDRFKMFLQTLVDEASFLIHNPFSHLTKAEITEYGKKWPDLISETISCWQYGNFTATLRNRLDRKEITHCGFCLPCLVRRLALQAAAIEDPMEIYAYNVFEAAQSGFGPSPDRSIPWTEAKALLKFAEHVEQIDDIWSFYTQYMSNLFHLDPGVDQKHIAEVYEMVRRFAREVLHGLK